ncbi:7346_t:CDS:2 [Funneliformis caledonium]|uniref:7346_t:CDS:1 n=1 Tax=Funneliformis caledonium TaxID=1117310 RepID=A0A9N8W5X8_9GLOM|nr:7346_t:CDS:2 [Funneliformis caledonium]
MSRSKGLLSPVQTYFNENSLPAKLNPSQKRSLFCTLLNLLNFGFLTQFRVCRYMADITLFCYVLGTPIKSAIPIDLGSVNKVDNVDVRLEKLNFGHLKKLIWPNNNIANELKLWKFATPLSEDNETLKELNKNFHKVIEPSNELSPSTKFLTEFPTDYEFLDNYIHIIVIKGSPIYLVSLQTLAICLDKSFSGGLGGTRLPMDQRVRPTNEGININDTDISLRFDVIPHLIKDFEDRNVILVRAPPFSGKTSMAQILENNLVHAIEFSNRRIIRVSMIWGQSVGVQKCFDSFNMLWNRIVGVDWIDWIGQCRFIETILIIDEVQLIYGKEKKIDENNLDSADQFWLTIKSALQEMANIKIIMFAAYGYRSSNQTGFTTPVTLPEENCKNLIDINFTMKELGTYIAKISSSYFKNLGQQSVSKLYEYIQAATEGHVGLVRHILKSIENAMKKRIDTNNLTWETIFKYLNSKDFDSSVYINCRAVPRTDSLTEKQRSLCEEVYLKGKAPYSINNSDPDASYLVKCGFLVVENNAYLTFAAPLLKRSFFQQNYGAVNSIDITPTDLYHFIIKIFTAMCNELSGKFLRETLGFGSDGRILEQSWQKEFYRIGTQVLGKDHFLSCDVGSVFGCDGKIDFYVDKLDWAIELLRDGDDMAEHKARFIPSTGEYKEIIKYAKKYSYY